MDKLKKSTDSDLQKIAEAKKLLTQANTIISSITMLGLKKEDKRFIMKNLDFSTMETMLWLARSMVEAQLDFAIRKSNQRELYRQYLSGKIPYSEYASSLEDDLPF